MSNQKLSEQLKNGRTDRPDEWTMDRYIQLAVRLESSKESCETRMRELSANVDRLQDVIEGCATLLKYSGASRNDGDGVVNEPYTVPSDTWHGLYLTVSLAKGDPMRAANTQ